LDYTIMIQLVYHNGETWHVKAVLEKQQQLPFTYLYIFVFRRIMINLC